MNKLFYIKSYFDLGILLLRIGMGCMLLLHGIGKFQDVLSGSVDFPDPLGLGSYPSLILVFIAEFFCSILVIVGLFTRLALIPIIITMLVIVFIHEWHLGIMDKEPPILFLIAFTGLFLTGAGKYSLDHFFHQRKSS